MLDIVEKVREAQFAGKWVDVDLAKAVDEIERLTLRIKQLEEDIKQWEEALEEDIKQWEEALEDYGAYDK